MFREFEPYLLSFLIGLLIGIDRERSLPTGMKGMGVRTFILLALVGAIAGAITNINLTLIITTFVLSAILLNYYTERRNSPTNTMGLTTGLAGSIVYFLGYLSHTQPNLSSALGGTLLITLLGRKWLHDFAIEKLKPHEIRAAATLLVIALCVLIFLPDKTLDPWNLFNPKRFGLLVAIIATMQFSGYVAIRIFGHHLGIIFMGFFGGLVSSTAVFATIPRFAANHPDQIRAAVAAALLALVGMLVEFTILVMTAAPALFLTIAPSVFVMIIVTIGIATAFYKKDHSKQTLTTPPNPLDFKSITYLSLMIGGMIIIVAIAKQVLGLEGVQLISFLGGLFEIHGVSLATSALFMSGKLALIDARNALLLAIGASFITKYVFLWGIARNKFALITSLMLSIVIASGVAAILIHF